MTGSTQVDLACSSGRTCGRRIGISGGRSRSARIAPSFVLISAVPVGIHCRRLGCVRRAWLDFVGDEDSDRNGRGMGVRFDEAPMKNASAQWSSRRILIYCSRTMDDEAADYEHHWHTVGSHFPVVSEDHPAMLCWYDSSLVVSADILDTSSDVHCCERLESRRKQTTIPFRERRSFALTTLWLRMGLSDRSSVRRKSP